MRTALAHKRFLAILIIAALLSFTAIFAINITFDPYYDFAYLTGIRGAAPMTVINYAELKYKLVLMQELRGQHAVVLVGASTTAGIDPEQGVLPTNRPVYNLAFSGADIYQLEVFLDKLLGIDPHLDIFVGLDFFGAKARAAPDLLYVGSQRNRYKEDALLRLIDTQTTLDYLHDRMDSGLVFSGYGARRFKSAQAPSDEISVSRLYWGKVYSNYTIAPDYKSRLARIASMFDRVTFFINPLYVEHYHFLKEIGLDEAYCNWINEVHAFPNVDFSFSETSLNPRNYHDAEHYSERAGFGLLATMLRDRSDAEERRDTLDPASCRAAFEKIDRKAPSQQPAPNAAPVARSGAIDTDEQHP